MMGRAPFWGVALPVWADGLIGVLLVLSGILALSGALGLVRIPGFFARLHPLALGATLAVWCAAAGLVIFFSLTDQTLALRAGLVALFMALTVPVTVILLARAALFRQRAAGVPDLPPALAGSTPSASLIEGKDPGGLCLPNDVVGRDPYAKPSGGRINSACQEVERLP